MKAVFLDSHTFSPSIELLAPDGVTNWQVFPATNAKEVVERLHDTDIVISNKVVIDAKAIAALPKLKLIQVAATGTNNIDHAACKQAGIVVQNVAGYSTTSVCEHTFMLIISLLRGLLPYHHAVTSGDWVRDGRFCLNELPLLDLEGKTLGIVGTGAIGKRVSEIARAFGMEVLWAERRGKAPRSEQYTLFEDVLARADIISLHCPLTPETENLINTETLALCKKRPLLINVSRGPVVDLNAVAQALQADTLLGFGCDVFPYEPPQEAESAFIAAVRDHSRVLFTPHNAWASVAAQKKLWKMLRHQVTQFIKENQ